MRRPCAPQDPLYSDSSTLKWHWLVVTPMEAKGRVDTESLRCTNKDWWQTFPDLNLKRSRTLLRRARTSTVFAVNLLGRSATSKQAVQTPLSISRLIATVVFYAIQRRAENVIALYFLFHASCLHSSLLASWADEARLAWGRWRREHRPAWRR